jgi:hypothetical protein
MNTRLLAISLCALVGACAEVPPPAPPPPLPPPGPSASFHAHDFAWAAERGSAGIRGAVDYMRDGRHYSCAGGTAVLTPDAPYSRQRIEQLYGSSERAALPVDEVRSRQANRPSDAYSAFVRRTTCDAQGRFVFQGLPAGSWFVIVVAQPAGGGQSMALMRRVDTHPGVVRTMAFD